MRLLLAALLLVPSAAEAAVDHPCHTPALFDTLTGPRGPAVHADAIARDKSSRNPWGVPNEQLTENFAIRWGDDWTANTSGLATLAAALEDAWSVQIGDMSHPAPWSADDTLLNVYIGDTGDGTPGSFGAGGYFNQDDAGYPMLVINPASLDEAAWTRVVAIHEFYHAVQWGLDTYTYVEGEPGAWYWEATASWIPGMVDPDSPANANFLWGFALAAHLPLDAFDYPDSGALQEFHQYGAMIFPTYISEHLGEWEPIRNSWVSPANGTNDPIVALRAELDAIGEDFGAVFTDFIAHNVFWDYRHGDTYALYVQGGQQSYPGSDPVTAWITGAGSDSVAQSEVPRRYGSNTLRFDLDPGDWRLELELDTTGSAGSPAAWGATLVRRDGDITYEAVDIVDGAATIEFTADGSDVGLALGAWSDTGPASERFGWSWTMTELQTGDDDDASGDDDDSVPFGDDDDDIGGFTGNGCGCEVADEGGASALALLLLLPLSRRRRQRR